MGKVRMVNSLESDRAKIRHKFYKLWDFNFRLFKLGGCEYYAVFDEDVEKPVSGLLTLTEAEQWLDEFKAEYAKTGDKVATLQKFQNRKQYDT